MNPIRPAHAAMPTFKLADALPPAQRRAAPLLRRLAAAAAVLLTAVVAGVPTIAPAIAAAPTTPTTPALLRVEINSQSPQRMPLPIRRIAVGNPAIADVNVVDGRSLLVTGKTLGITSLLVWLRNVDAPQVYRVQVIKSADAAAALRGDAELAQVKVGEDGSLSGRLPNLLAHRRAQSALQGGSDPPALADRSTVTLESQVMTEVKIADVSRSTLQKFGLNAMVNRSTTGGVFVPGGFSGATRDAAGNYLLNAATGVAAPLSDAFNIVVGDGSANILGVLSLLEGKGLARVLAEPSLVASSGQTASYLAGGEFPVPVSQGGATAGAISIQYKEFGVRLSLSPTVLARERIALKVAPEVSDLDFSAGIQIGGVSVPALRVRRTDTTVELGDGESLVISGLVSSSLLNSVDKLPWLGDIPVLGAFFRSTSIQREDRELIMVVTPRLVRPLARNVALPPLPGAEYDDYRPGAARSLLLETGRFETGFSR